MLITACVLQKPSQHNTGRLLARSGDDAKKRHKDATTQRRWNYRKRCEYVHRTKSDETQNVKEVGLTINVLVTAPVLTATLR